MQKGDTDYTNTYKTSMEHRDTLMKVATTAIPGHRKTGRMAQLQLKMTNNGNKSDRGFPNLHKHMKHASIDIPKTPVVYHNQPNDDYA